MTKTVHCSYQVNEDCRAKKFKLKWAKSCSPLRSFMHWKKQQDIKHLSIASFKVCFDFMEWCTLATDFGKNTLTEPQNIFFLKNWND